MEDLEVGKEFNKATLSTRFPSESAALHPRPLGAVNT